MCRDGFMAYFTAAYYVELPNGESLRLQHSLDGFALHDIALRREPFTFVLEPSFQ